MKYRLFILSCINFLILLGLFTRKLDFVKISDESLFLYMFFSLLVLLISLGNMLPNNNGIIQTKKEYNESEKLSYFILILIDHIDDVNLVKDIRDSFLKLEDYEIKEMLFKELKGIDYNRQNQIELSIKILDIIRNPEKYRNKYLKTLS